MGPSVPRGPSEAQIKTEAELERERVKFENERRQFVERVGAYESLARTNLSGERSSFEVADWAPMDASGLFVPAKFDPSFDPTRYSNQDLSWFSAPNLGINAPGSTPSVNNPSQGLFNPLPANTNGSKTDRSWIDMYRGLQ
jgi:hypothetical protein